MPITAKQILVDPDRAEKLLKKNTRNRRIKIRSVDQYAKDMEEGRWRETGEPLQISDRNRLINGQHRLLAVIKSGTAQKFLLVQGVPDDSFDVLDTGKGRSAGDVLSIHGMSSTGAMSTLVRLILWYERDHEMTNLRTPRFTNREILDRAKRDNDYEYFYELIKIGRNTAKSMSWAMHGAKLAFALWLTEQHDESGGMFARKFMGMVSDITLCNNKHHPAAAFNKWATARSLKRKEEGKRDQWMPTDVAGYIRAWNAWCREGGLKSIRVTVGKLPKVSTLQVE